LIPEPQHPCNPGDLQVLYNSDLVGAIFKLERDVTFNRLVFRTGVSWSGTFTCKLVIYQGTNGLSSSSWAKMFEATVDRTTYGTSTTAEVANDGGGSITLKAGIYALVCGRASGSGSPYIQSWNATSTLFHSTNVPSGTHPSLFTGAGSAATPPATINPLTLTATTSDYMVAHRFKTV
jgi:hypothetical protein